jgi:hypothetical protein
MKILCKCGNIENIETDKQLVNFELKECGDGTLALICKNCKEIVYMHIG